MGSPTPAEALAAFGGKPSIRSDEVDRDAKMVLVHEQLARFTIRGGEEWMVLTEKGRAVRAAPIIKANILYGDQPKPDRVWLTELPGRIRATRRDEPTWLRDKPGEYGLVAELGSASGANSCANTMTRKYGKLGYSFYRRRVDGKHHVYGSWRP